MICIVFQVIVFIFIVSNRAVIVTLDHDIFVAFAICCYYAILVLVAEIIITMMILTSDVSVFAR